jgi:hypothetical protein
LLNYYFSGYTLIIKIIHEKKENQNQKLNKEFLPLSLEEFLLAGDSK